MRRPLFAVALCLVIIAAIRLETGGSKRQDGINAGLPKEGRSLIVTGQVYQKDEESVYLKSVIFLESNALGQSEIESSTCKKLICETEAAPEIPLGSTVTLSGVFAPYSQATNPGEFDAAIYYRTLGIRGKLRKAVLLSGEEGCWKVREGLYRLKCFFRERLYHIFPEKEAAVMSALLLGEKGDLDGELKDLYKRNGILHILSISSLHITIIGMGAYKLLRKAGMPICPAAAAGSILLLLYGGMTGFSTSACRAIGMYLIRMLAEAVGRTYDMLTALGIMGAVMAASNPYYLQNSGFVLSFTSVLGIGLLYPALMPEIFRKPSEKKSNLEKLKRKISESLCQSAFASLSVTLATLPVQLWFYYEVPSCSVFLNLLVIPFLQPMMITGLLTLVPGLGFLGGVDSLILKGYEFFCGCFDGLPFRTWNPGCPRPWQIIIYYIIIIGAAVIASQKRRAAWARVKTAAVVLSICIAVLTLGIHPSWENRVIFLDVGQGDCILLQTASGQCYLFDCGSSSRSNIGKYVLLPCLKYYGVHTLDAVFLSHSDSDHINGAVELFAWREENNISVKQLVLPDIEESAREEQYRELRLAAKKAVLDSPTAIRYISKGDSWDCGSAVFTCLHPAGGYTGENANAYSECFYVEFRESQENSFGGNDPDCCSPEEGTWSLLLTGDVEGEGEAALMTELSERDIRAVTVLKVAHHGSRNSTSEKLLQRLTPGLAVISCGKNNRYGHPHRELLERLEAAGCYVLQTSQSGAVILTLKNGTVRADFANKK